MGILLEALMELGPCLRSTNAFYIRGFHSSRTWH